jgi:F-type H+-transporting ATPase subunit delta
MPTEIESEIAHRYAQALFDVARDTGRLDEHLTQLLVLRDLVAHTPEFLQFLSAPHIDQRRKIQLLRRTLGTRFLPTTLRFVEVLTSSGRVSVITNVIEAFEKLVDRWRGVRDAVVRTAVALDDAQRQQVQFALESLLRARLKIGFLVDPELIGGIIVQSEDTMIDGSVRGELQRLKYQLEKASLGVA